MMSPLFAALLTFASANPAESRCVNHLVRGDYCLDSQAEIICGMVSEATVACAMDMVDMKLAPDIFEALDYCRFPFDGKRPR